MQMYSVLEFNSVSILALLIYFFSFYIFAGFVAGGKNGSATLNIEA